MQGRYITHQATRALGAQERITAVTSYRPKSVFVKDDTVLQTIRSVSDLDQLYYDYSGYRLQRLHERLRHECERLLTARQAGEPFDTDEHKRFLDDINNFNERSSGEIVHPSQVRKGHVMEIDIRDAVHGEMDALWYTQPNPCNAGIDRIRFSSPSERWRKQTMYVVSTYSDPPVSEKSCRFFTKGNDAAAM